MPLTEVPQYLLHAIRVTRVNAGLEALEGREDPERVIALVKEAAADLSAWAEDENFWTSTTEVLAEAQAGASAEQLAGMLDQELEVLTKVLDGDRQLATLIVVETSSRSPAGDEKTARVVVMQLREEAEKLPGESDPRRRLWGAARLLRRAFKAVGGGLMIAADITVPDPSLLLKVASVWGGVDMILDAARA